VVAPSCGLRGGCDGSGEGGGGGAGGRLEGPAGLRRRGGEDSFEHCGGRLGSVLCLLMACGDGWEVMFGGLACLWDRGGVVVRSGLLGEKRHEIPGPAAEIGRTKPRANASRG